MLDAIMITSPRGRYLHAPVLADLDEKMIFVGGPRSAWGDESPAASLRAFIFERLAGEPPFSSTSPGTC